MALHQRVANSVGLPSLGNPITIDYTNQRMGIGTTSPVRTFHAEGSDPEAVAIRVKNTNTSADRIRFVGDWNSFTSSTNGSMIHH